MSSGAYFLSSAFRSLLPKTRGAIPRCSVAFDSQSELSAVFSVASAVRGAELPFPRPSSHAAEYRRHGEFLSEYADTSSLLYCLHGICPQRLVVQAINLLVAKTIEIGLLFQFGLWRHLAEQSRA